jgi:glycosyltransferase involved in cell wall biosynthesis
MKICLINNLFKPYSRGGADRISEIIANGLLSRGYEVFVISSKPFFTKFPISPHKGVQANFQFPNKSQTNSRWTNLKIKIYYISSLFYNLENIPYLLRIFWHLSDMISIRKYNKLNKILTKEKPDLIITNNLKGLGLLTSKLIRKLGIRHFHILHDIQLIYPSGLMIKNQENTIQGILARIYYSFNRKLFGSPEIIISPSGWLLDMHLNRNFFPSSKTTVMPNPIENKRQDAACIFTDNLKQNNDSNMVKELMYVGQIEDHKGVFDLLSAYKILIKEISIPIKLTFIGGGRELEKLKLAAMRINNVSILGRIDDREQLENMISNAYCVIVPSLCYENSPTVIYEAFSLGIPFIAANIGGIPELSRVFNGILFEAGDTLDLKEKMKSALEHPQHMIEREKQLKIIKSLNIENYLAKLVELF